LLDIANCIATGCHFFAVARDRMQGAGEFHGVTGLDMVLELCLKLYCQGMYNVITPHVRVCILSAGLDAGGIFDVSGMSDFTGNILMKDPFHHPGLRPATGITP
jgi:hypothetical protein